MPAPAAQHESKPARIYHRAPKGGAVCPLTGAYRKGGQFMKLAATPADLARTSAPAPLEGSSRQVAWATRIRSGWLRRLDAKLTALRGALKSANRREATAIRGEIRRVEGKRFRVWCERDAAVIVGRHAALTAPALQLASCA